MQLRWTDQFHGPNIFAPSAIVVARIQGLEHLDMAQILTAQKTLWSSTGLTPPERQQSNTPASDDPLLALAQIATQWALAALNVVRGFLHHAGAIRDKDAVHCWVSFHHPQLSRHALQIAFKLLAQALSGSTASATAELQKLWQACRAHHPDFQARILMVGAQDLNAPYFQFLPASRYWQFGWGARSQVFFETGSNADGALGWQWQRNKIVSKQLMQSMGLPTPQHVLIEREDQLESAAAQIGYPCVIKPMDGGGGKGVTANITQPAQLHAAFREARQHSRAALILEQHVPGTDYRLMVVRGKLVAAIERQASSVVGDGSSSLRELLKQLNAQRHHNLVKSHYLKPIAEDGVLQDHLHAQGLRLDDIPTAGTVVSLRSNANRSTGGISADVTHKVHPQLRTMAEQLATVCGLANIGLDYLTTDVSKPPALAGGAFIEINATPGMAVLVAAGWAESAIARIVLGSEPGRIPVTLHLLPAAELSSVLQSLQNRPLNPGEGWVCGDVMCVGTSAVTIQRQKPWDAVYAALRHRALETLQIFCTGHDIARHGLPLDQFTSIECHDTGIHAAWLKVIHDACLHQPS